MSRKSKETPTNKNMSTTRINRVSAALAFALLVLAGLIARLLGNYTIPELWIGVQLVVFILAGIYILFALQIAEQWEKGVVLRFGRFRMLAGPGLFWIIPIAERVVNWIDHRVMVTPFSAEKTLTRDLIQLAQDQPTGRM